MKPSNIIRIIIWIIMLFGGAIISLDYKFFRNLISNIYLHVTTPYHWYTHAIYRSTCKS